MDSLTETSAQSSRKSNPVRWFPDLSQRKSSVDANSVKTKIVRWFPDLHQYCTNRGEKQNPLPKVNANGEKTVDVCLFPKRPRSNTTTRMIITPCRAANTLMGVCATGNPGKRQCPNAEGEQSRERDNVQDMSENFVVKEMLHDSVAQELQDNSTKEEEPSDDDDEEGESSDDDDEEEETSEDVDSKDTDSEDDEGENESGIYVDMFKKGLNGDLLGEAKQIIAQEVRRGLYNKSSKSQKPPYNLGKRGRNVCVYNKKDNYHVNMKNIELVLKEDCCKTNCYKKFTAVDVFYKREEFWAMKQPEQLNFFLAEMRVASYFSDEGDLEVLRVIFNGVKVCTKAWGKLYGCSTTRVAKVRKEFREGMVFFNQHFRIKRNDDGEVRIWSKQYHNSQWQPNDRKGLDIFKLEPTGHVQASPKHAIQSLEARYRLTCRGEDERRDKVVSSEGHVRNRKVGGSSKFKVDDDVLSIAALKAHVHVLSHYAQPHNIEWWNKFIATQETLDLEDTNLKEPFAWPSVTADVSRADEEVPPTAIGFDQRLDDLFPPKRPIYIGARKSRQFREDRDGKYNDLEVNTFIALRACSGQEERVKPYHIGKVVELLAGKRFKVAWFAQREKGEGYYPQFKTNPQGKTTREPSEDVYDWSCDVLCYNFQLKTDRTLFSQTRQKISEMLNFMTTEDVD
ncbi:hypothetical protein CBR_g51278 [Chara braunii]|uniref:Uncharacterized protein n=1 Tax=Chara braunii TaxID=69332 RepID=A0A388M889_CHABU|nr:hypothetical protein CBR_g51278 [Chara braunii]|eukprot:GBG90771.1 hypothetical protein CBR_g51278 [Chara braunii]